MIESSDSRDMAARSGGMSLADLERKLADMENEPVWRPSSNKCADYYDHKQSSQERIQRAQETGEPMSTINLIQRTINGALGQEAKTRLNWKVSPDSDAFSDVAAVFGEKLTEAQREAKTDMAISEAYSSMLRTGIGWVSVDRNPDPLAYPYRVHAVHRNEVWWDWRSKLSDLSDAQWMIRQRWADLEEVQVLFPKYRHLLDMGTHSGPITDAMAQSILTSQGDFESIHLTRRTFSRTEEEWLDNSVRKRIRLYAVYYKAHKEAIALVMGTKRVPFNKRNPYHVALVMRGAAKLMRGPSYEMRRAMFCGPFRLYDEALPGRHFPLIPFICYRADDDFSPYGLVHGMIEPQDEFNERRSRLLWLLKAKQVFVDNDALDSKFNNFLDLAREVMRPDALFVLNANRRNPNGLRVEMNPQLGAEQATVMEDAKNLIQDVPGLFSPQFGSNKVGAESGVALNTLTDMSTASLGETSDNYRTSRQLVGDALMCEISQDHKEPEMVVMVGTGRKRRPITLNSKDEAGLPVNSVDDAPIKVALGDVPSTPSFRAQQQVFLSEAIRAAGNNPAAQAVLLPALFESSDLEHREVYAKWMRQQAGVPDPDDMANEDMEAQREQAKQAEQAVMAEANKRATAADIALKEAKAIREQAEAALTKAREALTQIQTIKTAAEAEAIANEPTEDEQIDRVFAEADQAA
jgi:hypothetical protein